MDTVSCARAGALHSESPGTSHKSRCAFFIPAPLPPCVRADAVEFEPRSNSVANGRSVETVMNRFMRLGWIAAFACAQPCTALAETVQFNGLLQGWFMGGDHDYANTFRLRRAELKLSGELADHLK